MLTIPFLYGEIIDIRNDIQGSIDVVKNSGKASALNAFEQEADLILRDDIAEQLCCAIFLTLPCDTQRAIVAQLPEENGKAMLASLAMTHGCDLRYPTPTFVGLFTTPSLDASSNGIATLPSVARFLPCLTPVGPGHCLHPGSHHEGSGRCTHPGCDCAIFSPPLDTPKTSVGVETVLGYALRIAALGEACLEHDDIVDGLRTAHIPPAAPASDWVHMLGRAFPSLVNTIMEHAAQ